MVFYLFWTYQLTSVDFYCVLWIWLWNFTTACMPWLLHLFYCLLIWRVWQFNWLCRFFGADKEEMESRRPPAVMTSSTPGNFECDLHDSNPHLAYKDSSSNSWGGSLQRKKANMSKCRHQQEDCQSLASLEAMVKTFFAQHCAHNLF